MRQVPPILLCLPIAPALAECGKENLLALFVPRDGYKACPNVTHGGMALALLRGFRGATPVLDDIPAFIREQK